MSDENETPEDVIEELLAALADWMAERDDGSIEFRDAVERMQARYRGRFGNALARERNRRGVDAGQ